LEAGGSPKDPERRGHLDVGGKGLREDRGLNMKGGFLKAKSKREEEG